MKHRKETAQTLFLLLPTYLEQARDMPGSFTMIHLLAVQFLLTRPASWKAAGMGRGYPPPSLPSSVQIAHASQEGRTLRNHRAHLRPCRVGRDLKVGDLFIVLREACDNKSGLLRVPFTPRRKAVVAACQRREQIVHRALDPPLVTLPGPTRGFFRLSPKQR